MTGGSTCARGASRSAAPPTARTSAARAAGLRRGPLRRRGGPAVPRAEQRWSWTNTSTRTSTAVRDVAERVAPDLALANHLVMGPAILARALGGAVPYAVMIHGRALEYTVKPHPASPLRARGPRRRPRRARGLPPHRREPVGGARRPRAARGGRASGPRAWTSTPSARATRQAAAAGVRRPGRAPARRSRRPPTTVVLPPDPAAAARRCEGLRPGEDRIVAFLGKQILAKGVDLLLAAWPLVLQRRARRAPGRRRLRRLAPGGGTHDRRPGRRRPRRGARDRRDRAAAPRGARRAPLRHLLAFLDALDGEPDERYLAAARGMRERVMFTGRLEHEEVADLLPAVRGARRAQHVPGGLRHGRGRGGGVRRAADQRGPLRPRRGQPRRSGRRAVRGRPLAALPARRRGGAATSPACSSRWLEAPDGAARATRVRSPPSPASASRGTASPAGSSPPPRAGWTTSPPHLDSRLGAWQARRTVSDSQLQQIGHR